MIASGTFGNRPIAVKVGAAKNHAHRSPQKPLKGGHLPELGKAVRKAWRGAKKSQADLASAASLCRNAVVAVEGRRGNIGTIKTPADALNLAITGRVFTGVGMLGDRLLALRKRRRLSRRKTAAMAGICIPSIDGIERSGTGHVVSLEALGRAVGARLCLVAEGTSPDFSVAARSKLVAQAALSFL